MRRRIKRVLFISGFTTCGAVLEQTILDFQNQINHAIYVAPCLSPEYQKTKWYNLMISLEEDLRKKIAGNSNNNNLHSRKTRCSRPLSNAGILPEAPSKCRPCTPRRFKSLCPLA